MSREHLLLGAVLTLGWGSVITFGAFDDMALELLLAALALMALAAAAPRGSAGMVTWASAVALTAAGAFRYAPRLQLQAEIPPAAVLVTATVAAVLARGRRIRLVAFTMAVCAVLAMAAVPWHWGAADIDVFYLMQSASDALLHGQNPYTTTLAARGATGPSALHFHYLYFPGAALIAAPGRLLGDVRVMSVVAFAVLIAFVVRLARNSPGEHARAVKLLALCLALPTTAAMVHWAWVDVYSVAGLAGWLAFRQQHQRWSIALLAMSLSIKPTILIALVPAVLWSRRARRESSVAAVIAVALILPFVLITGPRAFYEDLVGVHITEGFRSDALVLSAWSYQLTGRLIPVAISLVAGALLAYVALRRRPADLADNMIAAAFLSTAAFLLSQGAFLNYYFIPLWLLVLAIAGQGVTFDVAADIRLPVPGGRHVS